MNFSRVRSRNGSETILSFGWFHTNKCFNDRRFGAACNQTQFTLPVNKKEVFVFVVKCLACVLVSVTAILFLRQFILLLLDVFKA